MRYSTEQKREMRAAMLSAMGRGLRKNGFAGSGVDDLARRAGVTSGAIYSQFGSKQAVFLAALEAGLDEVAAAIPDYQNRHGAGWVWAFAGHYLGRAHREDLEGGCVMAALTGDVVRAGEEAHRLMEDKMQHIAALAARGLKGGSEAERLARAWALISLLAGGLNLTRAMQRPEPVQALAESLIEAAVQAAGPARDVSGG